MNWQEELRTYFEKEDYENCIDLLKDELTKPFCKDEDLFLNLFYVYMYMYILKKTGNTEAEMLFLSRNSLVIYKVIRQKFENSAKAIFYTAYIVAIADWVFDLNTEEQYEMYHKALLLDPANKLYQYGYYVFALNDQQKGKAIYEEIRGDEKCCKEIEEMSILGSAIIKDMLFLYTGEPQ